MTTDAQETIEVRELDAAAGWETFERAAQHYLSMSAHEFVDAWQLGKFDEDPERPEVMRVAMLLPLVDLGG